MLCIAAEEGKAQAVRVSDRHAIFKRITDIHIGSFVPFRRCPHDYAPPPAASPPLCFPQALARTLLAPEGHLHRGYRPRWRRWKTIILHTWVYHYPGEDRPLVDDHSDEHGRSDVQGRSASASATWIEQPRIIRCQNARKPGKEICSVQTLFRSDAVTAAVAAETRHSGTVGCAHPSGWRADIIGRVRVGIPRTAGLSSE